MTGKEAYYALQVYIGTHKSKVVKEAFNVLEKDIELLKALKQLWEQEEWCQGISLSIESLNSLFKYNKDLFEKNLELDKKVLELEKENQEAVKIATLLKNKKGYIKSKKGNLMELRISNITHNGSKFMVNGYCTYSDNCRYVPLNKVYVSEVLGE